jgi:HSP20 family protein
MAVLGLPQMELPPKKKDWKNERINSLGPFPRTGGHATSSLSVLGHQTQRRQDGEKESITVAEWVPLVDIIEDEKEYLIKADFPETKKDEIKVTLENGILVLSGERKLEKEDRGRKYHRIERVHGSFGRSFSLPDNADPEKVNAEFKDGVLKVHISKSEAARPKQIEVKIS